jgi:hypothetical protein
MDFNLPTGVKVEEERDVSGFAPLPSGVYEGVMQLGYLGKSDKGALSATFLVKADNRVVSQTIYYSNRDGDFTYKSKTDGSMQPLPGYSQVDAILLAVTGKGITEQELVEKVVTIYDYTARKEVPSKRSVFEDTINKPVAVGINHISEEKTTKESGYKDGTGEFRQFNEFTKWFNPETGLTNTETKAGAKEPKFLATWKSNNTGNIIVRKAANTGATQGTTGAPVGAAPAPASSLFT